MKRQWRRITCSFVLIVGCSRSSNGAVELTGSDLNVKGAPGAEAASNGATHSSGPAEPALEPHLSITNLGPGRFALRSEVSVDLRTFATIERRAADRRWVPYDDLDGGRGLGLVQTCEEKPAPAAVCRRLEGGKLLLPVPWGGFSCAAQCNASCDKNVFRSGIHRLVVRDCRDPAGRFEGPPFEMPPSPEMVPRWRANSDVESGRIVRLEPRALRGGGASTVERIAGVRARPGSPRPVAVEMLAEIGTWLRSPTGFDDRTERRCSPGTMFGLVLVRHPLPELRETTEIAIDLSCRSIVIVSQEGPNRVTTRSYFDPSRAEIVSWAKRALPGDGDIARTH